MADGPDDPKQKADKAWRWCERQWDRAPSPSQMVEAAVTASIEAALVEALAPVLERVARLEELAQFPTLMAENDALLQKMAAAPCATCGGARWVCDVSVDGASYHRKPCPDCSKPAAGPEGEAACTRHGQYRCPACAAGMVEEAQPPSPAESKGKPDWADWMATNEYHQSLGAKWMCEAIVRKCETTFALNRSAQQFATMFARKWEAPSFWRPTEPAHDRQ